MYGELLCIHLQTNVHMKLYQFIVSKSSSYIKYIKGVHYAWIKYEPRDRECTEFRMHYLKD